MTQFLEWLENSSDVQNDILNWELVKENALEKEKEQLMKMYEDGHDMTYNSCQSGCMGQMILEVSKEQYYNQTYNQNK